VLAKHVFITDAQSGWLIPVFQVLRRFSNDAARKKLVAAANRRPASQINVRTNDALCADLNSFIYYGIRPHVDRRVQSDFGMNNRRRMNH
jgi:hypothetical protein